MKRLALALTCLLGCSATSHDSTTAPIEKPASTTACYAGITTGMGQRARTLARRTLDPAANQIIEDVSHDDASAHGAKSFHVVMAVSGAQFTMSEASGAFTGTGTLAGDPWKWTSWTSTSVIPKVGITVDSDDELTASGMKATKQIKKDGKVIATTTEELKSFDCAEWDKAVAELATPALDAPACDRACRNYATLKYWQSADAQIAALPAAQQASARTEKQAEFSSRLEAGLASCTKQCLTSNNAVQTACFAAATSADQLTACE